MTYDIQGSDGPILGDDMMGELMLGDDMMGDEMGDEILGARRRGAMARRAPAGLTRPPLIPARNGLQAPAVGRLPLGFGSLSLTAGGATGGALTARPQVPWRGSKLIVSIAGVNSGNYAVLMQPLIGNKPVLAGAAAIDARSFPATGIDNNLISDSANAGIDVTLNITISPALSAGDTVLVTATWIGDAVV